MLILWSLCSTEQAAALIEILRSISSGSKSVTVFPLSTLVKRDVTPPLKRMAAAREVFPDDPCPTRAMFLILSVA